MKFHLDLPELVHALNVVKYAIGKGEKGHEGIRLYFGKNGRVKLTTNNGDTIIEHWLTASKYSGTGKAVIKAQKFIQYISNLQVDTLTLEKTAAGAIVAKSKRGQQTFVSFSEDTFNLPVKYDQKDAFNLSGTVFKQIVGSVAFAAQKDNQRPILEGINLVSGKGVVEVTTTNGIMIANFKKKVAMPDMNITVYRESLEQAARFVADDQKVTLQLCDDSRFVIKSGDTTYHVPLLAGNYPSLSKIIPKTFDFECVVDKEDFNSMLKRATAMLDTTAIMNLDAGKLTITGKTEDGEFNEFIMVDLQGASANIKLDMKRLHETVRNINSDNIIIGVREKKPIALRPDNKTRQICLVSTVAS